MVLLAVGFFAAAFAAVYRLEDPDNKWMTVPWWLYFSALAIGIVGIVFIRKKGPPSEEDDKKSEAGVDILRSSLTTLNQNINELAKTQEDRSPNEIVQYIDDKLTDPFGEFADSRKAMVDQFGLQVYADVMTQFASGERFTNRAWSAAADGYVDEVRSSLERAQSHLQLANDLLTKAQKEG